jgi:hypothetical protein
MPPPVLRRERIRGQWDRSPYPCQPGQKIRAGRNETQNEEGDSPGGLQVTSQPGGPSHCHKPVVSLPCSSAEKMYFQCVFYSMRLSDNQHLQGIFTHPDPVPRRCA